MKKSAREDKRKWIEERIEVAEIAAENCRNKDHASTSFQLKIKEAIHIQWEKPTLNQQRYHVNLKRSL